MVEIIDAICGLFGVATTDVADKLVDASAAFQTKGVSVGDLVVNRIDATSTIVLAIDSETQLTLRDDIFDTGEEYIIAGHLEKRWRFSKQDNLIDQPPVREELEEQVYSALGEINAFPPKTGWSLEDCYNDVEGGRRSLLMFGAAKNVAQLLLSHFSFESFDAQIGDLSYPSKIPEIESLHSNLVDRFNERLEKLKEASEKHITSASGSASTQHVLSSRFVWSQRW
jgi:hypothetical protein